MNQTERGTLLKAIKAEAAGVSLAEIQVMEDLQDFIRNFLTLPEAQEIFQSLDLSSSRDEESAITFILYHMGKNKEANKVITALIRKEQKI